jgi:hypothetical protein
MKFRPKKGFCRGKEFFIKDSYKYYSYTEDLPDFDDLGRIKARVLFIYDEDYTSETHGRLAEVVHMEGRKKGRKFQVYEDEFISCVAKNNLFMKSFSDIYFPNFKILLKDVKSFLFKKIF